MAAAVLTLRTELFAHPMPEGWLRAFVDFRGDEVARTIKFVLRVVRAEGRAVALYSTPLEHPPRGVRDCVYELWKLRRGGFDPVWYGLKITIDRTGAETVEFNADPACAADPEFCDY